MKIGHGLIVNEKPQLAHITELLKEWTLIVCVKNESGRLQRDIRPVQRYGSNRWCIKDSSSFNRYVKNSRTIQYVFLRNFSSLENIMWNSMDNQYDRLGLTTDGTSDLRYNDGSFFSKLVGHVRNTPITCFNDRNYRVDNLKDFKKIANINIAEIDRLVRLIFADRTLVNQLLPDESPRKNNGKKDEITISQDSTLGRQLLGRGVSISYDKTDCYVNQLGISNLLTVTRESVDIPPKLIWYKMSGYRGYVNIEYRVTINEEVVQKACTKDTQKQKLFKKLNTIII